MDKQNEIQKTKLLLVEGNHERDVFNAWRKALEPNGHPGDADRRQNTLTG